MGAYKGPSLSTKPCPHVVFREGSKTPRRHTSEIECGLCGKPGLRRISGIEWCVLPQWKECPWLWKHLPELDRTLFLDKKSN